MSQAREHRKKDARRNAPLQVPPPILNMMLTGMGFEPIGSVSGITDPLMKMHVMSGNLTVSCMMPAATWEGIAQNGADAAIESMRLASGLVVAESKLHVPGK